MESQYSKVQQEDFYSPTFTFEPPEEQRELTLRDPSINGNEDKTSYYKGRPSTQTIPGMPSTDLESQTRYSMHPTQSTEPNRGLDHKRTSLFQVSLSDLTKSPWVSTGSFYEPKSTERRRIEKRGSHPELSSDRLLSSRLSYQARSPEKGTNILEKRQAMKIRRENRSVSSMSDFFRTQSGYQGSRRSSLSRENSMMESMKNEIDELRQKLKEKEIQLQENINFIENIQGSIRSGENGDFLDLRTLQSLHQKACQLERENLELRETLRNEVLASERQRSELDIVREALNERLSHVSMASRSKMDSVDIFLENEKALKKLESAEMEIVQLSDKVATAQNRIQFLEAENAKLNKSLKEANNDRQRLKEDIENGIKALKAAREEARQLEEDKTTIMNFVNNEVLQERNLFKIEGEKLREENKRLADQLKTLMQELEHKNNQIDLMERERQTLIEETTLRFTNQKDEASANLEKEIAFLKSEKDQLINEKEALKQKITSLEEMRSELLNKEKAYQTQIQTLTIKLQNIEHEKEYEMYQNDVIEKEQKELYEKRIQEVLKDRSNLQAEVQNLEYENKKLSSQKDELVNKLTRLQARCKELEEQANNLQNLRKEELQKCQEAIAGRDREIGTLKAENTKIKADVENLKETMTKAMDELKSELEIKMREAENFRHNNVQLQRELDDLKEANKALNQSLNYQTSIKQLEMINSSQKDIDITLLREENLELKTEVDEYEERLQKIQRDLNALKQRNTSLEQNNQALQRELDLMVEDNDRLETEYRRATEEIKEVKEKENYFKNSVMEILAILNSFVQALNKNANTANNFLHNCTPKLKEMLTTSYLKMATDNLGRDIDKAAEYMQEWFVLMLEEIEKDVLKIFKMKEEARMKDQELEDLKNKLNEMGLLEQRFKEVGQECDELKQEKFELQQRLISIEKNEAKLKKELQMYKEKTESLSTTIEDLQNVNELLKKNLEDHKRDTLATKAQMETENMLNKTLESQYDYVLKEKKHLSELLDTIVHSIPNPDHAKLIRDIIDLQFDIIRIERSSSELEEALLEREAELKAVTKKTTKPTLEITEARKEVERLRTEYQNAQSQLAIFIKRKALLQEELSHLERTEKRRFEYGLEVEKSISKYRDDYNEMKSKYEDLLQINSNLQARMKDLVESNYHIPSEASFHKNRLSVGTYQDHFQTMNERIRSHLLSGYEDDLNNRHTKSNSSVLQGSPLITTSQKKEGRRSITMTSGDLSPMLASEEKNKINSVNVTKIRLRDKLNEARNVIRNAREDQY